MTTLPGCAVVVLNYNGVPHLRELLPSLREAVDRYPGQARAIVVDNRSTGPDVAWMREHHADIETIVTESNDYLFSLNPIVARVPEEIVVILNNDMRVHPDFLAPLVERFRCPEVFSVAARVLDWDGCTEQIGRRMVSLEGFWLSLESQTGLSKAVYTVEAGGGCSAYRRRMFAELGGFDPLFRPGYWEDMDLTWRGWMRGWVSVHEPRSVIFHRGSGTFGGMSRRHLQRHYKHQTLFTARNVGGMRFAIGFLLLLPYRIVMHWLAGHRDIAVGMLQAIPRLPSALLKRIGAPTGVLDTNEILQLVRQPLELSVSIAS